MKLTRKQVKEIEKIALDILYDPEGCYPSNKVIEECYSGPCGEPILYLAIFFKWEENPEAEFKDIKYPKIKCGYSEGSPEDIISIDAIDLEAFNYRKDIID